MALLLQATMLGASRKEVKAVVPTKRLFHKWAALSLLLSFLLGSHTCTLRADTYYQAGKRAYSARNFSKAILLFQKAYKANPGNGNSLYYIGRIHDDQRKISKAVFYYKQAVRLRMDSQLREQALWKVLLYLKHKKNWEELLEYSKLFLRYKSNRRVERLKTLAEERYNPELAQIQRSMERAKTLEAQKKYPRAIRIYQDVISRRPNFHQARWALSRLLMKEKNYGQALSHFQYLIRNDENAWEYHYKSAVCLYRLGRLEQADSALQKAWKGKDEPGKSRTAFAYHYSYLKGKIAFEKNDFKQACKFLGQAYRLSPKRPSPKLLAIFALSAIECKDMRLARKIIQKLPPSSSHLPLARLTEARLAIHLRQNKRAWRLGKAILGKSLKKRSEELHASYTPLFFFLGKQAAKKFHYYTAIQAFGKVRISALNGLAREAKKKNPPRDIFGEFNYYYGISLMNTKQYARALHVLQKLKKNSKSYYLLARVYALQKDSLQASQMLELSAQEAPEFWKKAHADPPFIDLMQEDQEFREFMTKGKNIREQKESDKTKQKPNARSDKNAPKKSP